MDDILLTSPQGSVYNVGSYLRADPGPDFGAADLEQALYAENAAVEGGRLALERLGVRRFQLPLILSGNPSTLPQLEKGLRLAARPGGAFIDLKMHGVPTGEAVRFDVLAGRWEPDFQVHHNRAGIRLGMLKLDVEAIGYLPTMILLASAASVAGPGVLTIPQASIMGDAPGLAELFIAPTHATAYASSANWLDTRVDSLAWSLGARPSFQAHWRSGSAIFQTEGDSLASLVTDIYAPASQSLRIFFPNGDVRWHAAALWVVPPALEPAYRGEYHAYAWVKLGPSQTSHWYASFDAVSGTAVIPALASAAPVASLPPAVSSDGGLSASPAYHLLSLGELSLPPIASAPIETVLRLWLKSPTTNFGVSTAIIDVGGLYLQPLGAAGVLRYGLQQPTYNGQPIHRFLLSGVGRMNELGVPTSTVASRSPVALPIHYRGAFPRVGASTIQLDLNFAGRRSGDGNIPQYPPIRSEPHFAQVSVRYQPRFLFLKGV